MRDPVITTTPATAAASVEPTPAPAVRKRAARAPRAKAAVAAPASLPEVVAPVEAPKPVTPAKKVAVRKPAKAVKPAEAPQPAAPVEAPKAPPAAVKHKLIRDSFTFPENEYAQIEALKHKALSLAHHAKKSEILRAGIAALSALPDEALVAALKAVLPLKPGRPKSGKKR